MGHFAYSEKLVFFPGLPETHRLKYHEKILDCYYHREENRSAIEMILAESYTVSRK